MAGTLGNQNAVGNSGGKRKFATVTEMQAAIDAYFEKCDSGTKNVVTKEGAVVSVPHPRPYTIEGLALALGFNSRVSLLNYEGYTDDDNVEFLSTIKNARMRVQENKVSGMLSGDYATAGAIFDLKNNHGYADKQEIEHSGSVDGYTDEQRLSRLASLFDTARERRDRQAAQE